MQSVIEGVCAGLTALGAGLFAKARGWGPLRAAAAAGTTAFAVAWALKQLKKTKTGRGPTNEFL